MIKTSHDSETPAHGQQVFVACAFLYEERDGEYWVFLPKRADTKKFLPGVFELPGGHVDYGEDMVKGLQREVLEELGTRIKVGDPYYVYTYLNHLKGSHSIEVVYFASFVDAGVIKLNPDDHSEFGWFSQDQVRSTVAANRADVLKFDHIECDADHELLAMLKGFDLLNASVRDFA